MNNREIILSHREIQFENVSRVTRRNRCRFIPRLLSRLINEAMRVNRSGRLKEKKMQKKTFYFPSKRELIFFLYSYLEEFN